MNSLIINTDPKFNVRFKAYPEHVKKRMNRLRSLVLEVAESEEQITEIEETLKWGEPSFVVKQGSTIRIDWKARAPEQYAIYFKCTSKLVPAFKEVYGDVFRYDNNRAILFALKDKIPVSELKNCIAAALNYHKLKQIPNLGLLR